MLKKGKNSILQKVLIVIIIELFTFIQIDFSTILESLKFSPLEVANFHHMRAASISNHHRNMSLTKELLEPVEENDSNLNMSRGQSPNGSIFDRERSTPLIIDNTGADLQVADLLSDAERQLRHAKGKLDQAVKLASASGVGVGVARRTDIEQLGVQVEHVRGALQKPEVPIIRVSDDNRQSLLTSLENEIYGVIRGPSGVDITRTLTVTLLTSGRQREMTLEQLRHLPWNQRVTLEVEVGGHRHQIEFRGADIRSVSDRIMADYFEESEGLLWFARSSNIGRQHAVDGGVVKNNTSLYRVVRTKLARGEVSLQEFSERERELIARSNGGIVSLRDSGLRLNVSEELLQKFRVKAKTRSEKNVVVKAELEKPKQKPKDEKVRAVGKGPEEKPPIIVLEVDSDSDESSLKQNYRLRTLFFKKGLSPQHEWAQRRLAYIVAGVIALALGTVVGILISVVIIPGALLLVTIPVSVVMCLAFVALSFGWFQYQVDVYFGSESTYRRLLRNKYGISYAQVLGFAEEAGLSRQVLENFLSGDWRLLYKKLEGRNYLSYESLEKDKPENEILILRVASRSFSWIYNTVFAYWESYLMKYIRSAYRYDCYRDYCGMPISGNAVKAAFADIKADAHNLEFEAAYRKVRQAVIGRRDSSSHGELLELEKAYKGYRKAQFGFYDREVSRLEPSRTNFEYIRNGLGQVLFEMIKDTLAGFLKIGVVKIDRRRDTLLSTLERLDPDTDGVRELKDAVNIAHIRQRSAVEVGKDIIGRRTVGRVLDSIVNLRAVRAAVSFFGGRTKAELLSYIATFILTSGIIISQIFGLGTPSGSITLGVSNPGIMLTTFVGVFNMFEIMENLIRLIFMETLPYATERKDRIIDTEIFAQGDWPELGHGIQSPRTADFDEVYNYILQVRDNVRVLDQSLVRQSVLHLGEVWPYVSHSGENQLGIGALDEVLRDLDLPADINTSLFERKQKLNKRVLGIYIRGYWPMITQVAGFAWSFLLISFVGSMFPGMNNTIFGSIFTSPFTRTLLSSGAVLGLESLTYTWFEGRQEIEVEAKRLREDYNLRKGQLSKRYEKRSYRRARRQVIRRNSRWVSIFMNVGSKVFTEWTYQAIRGLMLQGGVTAGSGIFGAVLCAVYGDMSTKGTGNAIRYKGIGRIASTVIAPAILRLFDSFISPMMGVPQGTIVNIVDIGRGQFESQALFSIAPSVPSGGVLLSIISKIPVIIPAITGAVIPGISSAVSSILDVVMNVDRGYGLLMLALSGVVVYIGMKFITGYRQHRTEKQLIKVKSSASTDNRNRVSPDKKRKVKPVKKSPLLVPSSPPTWIQNVHNFLQGRMELVTVENSAGTLRKVLRRKPAPVPRSRRAIQIIKTFTDDILSRARRAL